MIKIIGAGMAGLLAARMLKHHGVVVYEEQASLPHNHSAVLRFRSPIVGDLLGVPFRRVRMTKMTQPWKNPVADQMAYSRKVTGVSRSDRSIPLEPVSDDRWIAPSNFIEHLSKDVIVEYGKRFDFQAEKTKVISTIPMPSLMAALDYDEIIRGRFFMGSVSGFNIRMRMDKVDAYVSMYVPDPSKFFNRVSITGGELIIEFSFPGDTKDTVEKVAREVELDIWKMVGEALDILGLSNSGIGLAQPTLTMQPYSKILPIPEEERRRFIFWASSIQRKAYQLGRFATWRPGLLVDDLVKDIRLIDAWIREGDYGVHIHEAEKRGN